MANYVDQINLNGNVGDIMGCGSDRIYSGVDLTTKFASEISSYSDAWAWIKARITAGNFSKLHVGDYIPVTCTNGNTFNARIAGINTYKGYGNTAVGNHIDFISASTWPTAIKMNLANFNNGLDASHPYPWLCSNGYHFLNSLSGSVPNGTGNLPEAKDVDYTKSGVYYYLPDTLKNVIVEKKALLPQRFNSSGTQTEDTNWDWQNAGKLWLPSEVEVAGMTVWGSHKYGASGFVQYPLFANNMNRVLGRSTWWTLSATSGHATSFVVINYTGTVSYYYAANDLRGPVCFRVA